MPPASELADLREVESPLCAHEPGAVLLHCIWQLLARRDLVSEFTSTMPPRADKPEPTRMAQRRLPQSSGVTV